MFGHQELVGPRFVDKPLSAAQVMGTHNQDIFNSPMVVPKAME
jgi:hypothetical protein